MLEALAFTAHKSCFEQKLKKITQVFIWASLSVCRILPGRVNIIKLTGTFLTGCTEESVTLELANRLSSKRRVIVPEPSAKDIDFSINADMQRTGDFNVTLTMKNTSDASRLVDVHISALSCKYTGIANADIKDTCTATVLEPNARK